MAESGQNQNCLTIARQLFDYRLAMNSLHYTQSEYSEERVEWGKELRTVKLYPHGTAG